MLDLVLKRSPEESIEPKTARVLLYKLFYDQTEEGMTRFLFNMIKSFDTHKQSRRYAFLLISLCIFYGYSCSSHMWRVVILLLETKGIIAYVNLMLSYGLFPSFTPKIVEIMFNVQSNQYEKPGKIDQRDGLFSPFPRRIWWS